MAGTILFHCSHGADDPERATLPFIGAAVAAASGQTAIVVCTIEAVWLGTIGGCDGIHAPGQPPLQELYDRLIDSGGSVWLCSACTNPRGIDEERCAPGAAIMGAAAVVEQIVAGARSVTFA